MANFRNRIVQLDKYQPKIKNYTIKKRELTAYYK